MGDEIESPVRRPRRGLVLAVAGAAVLTLVVVGTAYATRSPEPGVSSPGPTADAQEPHLPPLPALQTDAGNRAAATAAAVATLAQMPGYPGAVGSGPIAALGDDTLSTATPGGHTEVRSGFWAVSGAGPRAVAEWYAAHPPAGFSGEGGAVGGQSDGTTWISEVYFDRPGTELGGKGTSVEVQTTRIPAGVGVRVTVSSVWAPARPRASYVQDVTSIDVRTTHERYGWSQPTRRSFTVTDSAQVLRAARVFDDLSGMTAMAIPCPMPRDVWVDRIVFHTPTGDVSVVSRSSACGFGMAVCRDGQRVAPLLGGAGRLLPALGLRH